LRAPGADHLLDHLGAARARFATCVHSAGRLDCLDDCSVRGGLSLGEGRVLFLGEGPRPGYLDGVLQSAFELARVFGSQTIAEAGARLDDHRLFLLSDYGAPRLSAAEQERLIGLVEQEGRGLLMIGGWSSFAGPRGSYHGSRLAKILPVELM